MIRNLRNILCVLLFIAASSPLFAGHYAGANLSYQHISGNQYQVSLRFYRDCQGLVPPATMAICYSSALNNFSATVQATQSGTPFALPPFPYIPPMTTTCNGGSGFGLERYVYSTVITLPFTSPDWEFSSTIIGVVQTPTYSNFLVTTRLDNSTFPNNSSPVFNFDPVFLYCNNQPAYDDLSATDPDGDSLDFSLIPMIIGDDDFCPAQPTFPIPQNPFPVSTVPHTIDPTGGWVYFQPSQVGQAFMHMQVSEFRNGVIINTTTLWHQATVIAGCTVTGINEQEDNAISISPNPVKDELRLYTNARSLHYSVTDALGKVVMEDISEQVSGEHLLNVIELLSGVYFVKIVEESRVRTIKFVKS